MKQRKLTAKQAATLELIRQHGGTYSRGMGTRVAARAWAGSQQIDTRVVTALRDRALVAMHWVDARHNRATITATANTGSDQ